MCVAKYPTKPVVAQHESTFRGGLSYLHSIDLRNFIYLCNMEVSSLQLNAIAGQGAMNRYLSSCQRLLAMPLKRWHLGMYRSTRSNVSISLLEMASAKYHIQNFMNKITRALKEGMVYQS